MAAAHAEVCVWNELWQQDFQVYGGRVCNTLMEGGFHFLLYTCRTKLFFSQWFVDNQTLDEHVEWYSVYGYVLIFWCRLLDGSHKENNLFYEEKKQNNLNLPNNFLWLGLGLGVDIALISCINNYNNERPSQRCKHVYVCLRLLGRQNSSP